MRRANVAVRAGSFPLTGRVGGQLKTCRARRPPADRGCAMMRDRGGDVDVSGTRDAWRPHDEGRATMPARADGGAARAQSNLGVGKTRFLLQCRPMNYFRLPRSDAHP